MRARSEPNAQERSGQVAPVIAISAQYGDGCDALGARSRRGLTATRSTTCSRTLRTLRPPRRSRRARAREAPLEVDHQSAAKPRPMTTLTLHLWIGFAVAALAVLAVWQRTGRRITLYAVTLQILVGVVLVVQGVRGPWYHYALAVLGWAGYMAANALSRRPGGAPDRDHRDRRIVAAGADRVRDRAAGRSRRLGHPLDGAEFAKRRLNRWAIRPIEPAYLVPCPKPDHGWWTWKLGRSERRRTMRRRR